MVLRGTATVRSTRAPYAMPGVLLVRGPRFKLRGLWAATAPEPARGPGSNRGCSRRAAGHGTCDDPAVVNADGERLGVALDDAIRKLSGAGALACVSGLRSAAEAPRAGGGGARARGPLPRGHRGGARPGRARG